MSNSQDESDSYSLADAYQSEPIDSFDIGEIVERDVKQGKEVKIRDDDGEWWAGEWARKRMEASKDFPKQPTWVGYSTEDLLQGVTEVPIEFNSLFRHMAIFGTTGYGKSTLLKNIMIQWAHADYGFVYIDPKGDDVYELMEMLPEDRLDDVIWIEPGSTTHDKVVGINFLEAGLDRDDPAFENEASSIIDDLEDILRSEQYWGPTMSAIIQNVGGWMVRQEENYSMLDLYMLLSNEEERAKFADNVEDDIIKQYARQVSNKDQNEIDALLKRIQKWVESPVTREIVAHRESTVNLTQAVEEGKIVLVRSASVDRKDIKRAVATGIMRRVWSAIKSRENIPKDEREPFFMVVDEFDDVASEDADVDKMLSKARSYRLGIVLANQQPHQLPKSIVSAMMGNCDNILSLNPGNPDDARLVTKRLDNISDKDVLNLGRFSIYSRISIDAKKSPPFPMNTFAPYPPRRAREDVHKIIENILDEYGVKSMEHGFSSDSILDRVGKENNTGSTTTSSDSNQTITTETGEKITERRFLEATYAAHLNKGSIYSWVSSDEIKAQLESRFGKIEYGKFDSMVEQMPEKYLQRKMKGGDVVAQLTGEGERIAFRQDSGHSASGGKAAHRLLLKRAYEVFHNLGYNVTIPEQEGKAQPDGLAKPPINPFQEADSSLEEDKLRKKLRGEHPELVKIFGYDEVSIETESESRTKPKQPLKNLKKAVHSGRTCAFVVKEGKKNFKSNAATIDKILTEPPFVKTITDNKERIFYNKSQKIPIRGEDDTYALREDRGNCKWKDSGDGIALETSEGDEIATFKDAEEVQNPGVEKFEYNYTYDRGEGAMIVRDKSGKRVDSYTATADKKASQRMLEDGYSMVYKPFIPEVEFEYGLPDEDQWRIVIIPDGDTNKPPQLYQDGETIPIDQNLAQIQRDDSKEQTREETQSQPESQTQQSTSSSTTTKKSNEPKTSGEKPKSNTDAVKNSDNVWTKPEPGDDDYNPAKDNDNYRTGYDEEHSGADWTGGQARKSEKEGNDFENYTPPNQKKNKKQNTSSRKRRPKSDDKDETDNSDKSSAKSRKKARKDGTSHQYLKDDGAKPPTESETDTDDDDDDSKDPLSEGL